MHTVSSTVSALDKYTSVEHQARFPSGSTVALTMVYIHVRSQIDRCAVQQLLPFNPDCGKSGRVSRSPR